MKLEGAHPDTVLAHTGAHASTGHVTAPIAMSTTFARGEDHALLAGVDYARDGSPAYLDAEAALARLEGGSRALLFASGMAAATAVFLSLEPGAHVVIPSAMYWGRSVLASAVARATLLRSPVSRRVPSAPWR